MRDPGRAGAHIDPDAGPASAVGGGGCRAAALRAVSPRPDWLEPVMITPEQLASWSRRPEPRPTRRSQTKAIADGCGAWSSCCSPSKRGCDAATRSRVAARRPRGTRCLIGAGVTLSRVQRRWRLRLIALAMAVGGAVFALHDCGAVACSTRRATRRCGSRCWPAPARRDVRDREPHAVGTRRGHGDRATTGSLDNLVVTAAELDADPRPVARKFAMRSIGRRRRGLARWTSRASCRSAADRHRGGRGHGLRDPGRNRWRRHRNTRSTHR